MALIDGGTETVRIFGDFLPLVIYNHRVSCKDDFVLEF